MSLVDVKLIDNGDYFDFEIDSTGDFKMTEGLDSALVVSLFTDKRADLGEITEPSLRRGWWGNLFTETSQSPIIGSKIWLLDQVANTPDILNDLKNYIKISLDWLISEGYANSIEVNGVSNLDQIDMFININYPNGRIGEFVYDIWQNTLEEVNGG